MHPNAEPTHADVTEQDLDILEDEPVLVNNQDKKTFENKVRALVLQLHAQLITKAA